MNLSQYSKHTLFESFTGLSKAASWPTCSSMFCESALKKPKKYIDCLLKIGNLTRPASGIFVSEAALKQLNLKKLCDGGGRKG